MSKKFDYSVLNDMDLSDKSKKAIARIIESERKKKAVYQLCIDQKDKLQTEQKMIRQLVKSSKDWAKTIAKLDDENKQTLIDKLVKYGYVFDTSTDKLGIGVSFFIEIADAKKKLNRGAKASKKASTAKQKQETSPKLSELEPQMEEPDLSNITVDDIPDVSNI